MLSKLLLCLLVLILLFDGDVFAMWRSSGSGSKHSGSGSGYSSLSSPLLPDTDRIFQQQEQQEQQEQQYERILATDRTIERGKFHVHYGSSWVGSTGLRQAGEGWPELPGPYDGPPVIDPKGTIFVVSIPTILLTEYKWTFTIHMDGLFNSYSFTKDLPSDQNFLDSHYILRLKYPDSSYKIWDPILKQKVAALQNRQGYERAYEKHLLNLERSLCDNYMEGDEQTSAGLTMFVIRWQDLALAATAPRPERFKVFLDSKGIRKPSGILRILGIIQTGKLDPNEVQSASA